MIAQVTGLKAGEFIHTFGDVHLYLSHLEQARLQFRREPRPLPRLWLSPEVKDLFEFKYEDIQIRDYHPIPPFPPQCLLRGRPDQRYSFGVLAIYFIYYFFSI